MPLSHCRTCGKKIPNIFRKWHEQVQCIRARQLRGEYIDPTALKKQKKREEQIRLAEEEREKESTLLAYL